MKTMNEHGEQTYELTMGVEDFAELGIDPNELIECRRAGIKYPMTDTQKMLTNFSPMFSDNALYWLPDRPVRVRIPSPKHVYVSKDKRVTVVMWDDKTKTIVRCSDGDEPDIEKGIWAAVMKKVYGPRSGYKKLFDCVEIQGENDGR